MVFTIEACCGSFLGTGRETNQDNIFFHKKHLPVPNTGLKNPLKCTKSTDESVVFAVFDGMGGGSGGDRAACLASTVFSQELKAVEELALPGREYLLTACEKANRAVNALREESQVSTMGTTVAALHFSQDEVVSCNVGDSRIFRIRDKKMLQISEDHTDEKLLAAMGIRKKPVLLQYIGIPQKEMEPEPYITKGELLSGDAYVICSDGVTDVLTVQELYELISANRVDEAVRQILGEVNKRNGSDNATIIVAKLSS